MTVWSIINARAEDALRDIPDASIDSLVTDPPAGISFMGKAWDGDKGGRDQWIAWLAGILRECYRAMKPGAHGLVWALPRTSHWTATACEDAGFDVRDVVMHLFGTGFPKSHDVAKAIGKGHAEQRHGQGWTGWGTALKPAAEHWILIRKPLAGTVAENVLEFGTGGINVDGCRISGEKRWPSSESTFSGWVKSGDPQRSEPRGDGRFPANLTLDEQAAAVLDEQSGHLHGAGSAQPPQARWADTQGGYGGTVGSCPNGARFGDSGGASRFFYVAKGSTAEKAAGLSERNPHPTVKPIALMKWLARLITPPGGTLLDPFAGSGTTLIAASLEGFKSIGIEQSEEYAAIAEQRLRHWTGGDHLELKASNG